VIWGAFGARRDLPRLHRITSVLIRHGLGDLVRRIGIGTVLERAGQILHWGEASESAHLEPPERVRIALEELGPTFVKLGQVLSTREDLFPPKWIAEFERLQSKVAPVASGELLPEVEIALGRHPQEVFVDLDTTAYASASIAQVHRARLPNGTPVVLKIRRPGIQATVEADIRILTHIAALLEAEIPEARRYQPTQILVQFSRSLERELNLAVEARNIDRFAKNFAGDPEVLVPRVYWEWTSPVMNVQEYIEAIPGNDLAAIEAAGLNRKLLASRGADAVLRMILVDGFFHADPHPGNVFYLPGNRILMIDFGMVGRLTYSRRNQIVDLLSGIASRDEEGITEVILDWTGEAYVDEAKLAADMGELVLDYVDVPLKDVRIATLLRQVSSIMREHSIVLPADLTLMFKALITLEGLGRQYDPEFRLIDHLGPFLERAIAERYDPTALIKRGQNSLAQMFKVVSAVPRDLARLIKDLRRGRMRVDLDLKRLDSFGRRLDHTIDRITIGIMTASLVVGSSIVMTVPRGPTLFGMPLFTVLGLLGYVIAFCNSVWIIVSIWRADRD
jgi:ubiquinone biosynthesis protein